MNYYVCPKCCSLHKRKSKAKTVKSYCTQSRQEVKLLRVENAHDLAKMMCNVYLPNNIDVTSFKPKMRMFLEIAYEAGAIVMYNAIKNANDRQA